MFYVGANIDNFILSLQDSAQKVFQWFCDKQVKENGDKCFLLLIKNDETLLEVGDSLMKNKSSGKLCALQLTTKSV